MESNRVNGTQFEDADLYQRECRKTAIYPAERGPEYVALGLASEAGEVAGKIKKQIRDGAAWTGEQREDQRQAILAELGDVLWYAAQLCSEYNVLMSEVMAANINKLRSRNERGTISGNGDNR